MTNNHEHTVLLVEHDVFTRMSLAKYLRDCGYRVIEAVNSDEAMAVLLQQQDHAVDVVFADARLPGAMNGFELAGWLAVNFPRIEMIVTGTSSGAARKAAQLCEEGPQLARPYDPQLVERRIRQLVAARNRSLSH